MRPARATPTAATTTASSGIDPRRPRAQASRDAHVRDSPRCSRGDLLVVNDAATLPASLRGLDAAGQPVEARLVAGRRAAARFRARPLRRRRLAHPHRGSPAAPALPVGARVEFGALAAELGARVDGERLARR